MMQTNTEIEPSQDPRKYEIGTVLTFRGYDPDEVDHLGEMHRYTYQRGDRLVVMHRNCCGMGIDVMRLGDGVTDMVWPTEVALARTWTAPKGSPTRRWSNR